MARTRVIRLTERQLLQYARVGALAELNRLHEEIDAIQRAFPELARRPPERQALGDSKQRATSGRRRRSMSRAQRNVVSERMKKYWADRRKLKLKGKTKG
jgi:hypothetical protein